VPSRPASARGRRPGQARLRARRPRWKHAWCEAKGLRFYLRDSARIVHILSGPQVQNAHDLGAALQPGKEAGWIPEAPVRLWSICEGAEWIGKHGRTWFPNAWQGLDYSHGSASLPKVAKAQDGNSAQAQAWGEATLTRLSLFLVWCPLSLIP
jgi:hypothetical protein